MRSSFATLWLVLAMGASCASKPARPATGTGGSMGRLLGTGGLVAAGAGGSAGSVGGSAGGAGGSAGSVGGTVETGGFSSTGGAYATTVVDCGSLESPSNGSVTVSSTTYGSTAAYACSTGFSLVGSATRICQASGTWSDGAPTCEPWRCPNGATACDVDCESMQTDNANCGGCGIVCTAPAPSTARCLAGRCLVTLAAGIAQPLGIAVDGTSVYWASDYSGTVSKVPRVGGPATVLASGSSSPGGVVVDASNLYWSASDGVMKVPLTGGTPVKVLGTHVGAIAVDATNLYWATSDSLNRCTVGTTALVGARGPTIASFDGTISKFGLAVNATHAYWADFYWGTVARVELTGGTPVTLASGQTMTYGIALDTSNVYWTGWFPGAVKSMPLDGGAATTLATGRSPYAIAVDATHVYWTDEQAGTVMKVPLGGGAPTTLASGTFGPRGIAIDGDSVYWTGYANGTVMKISPK